MKTYILYLSLFFSATFFALAQDTNVEYCVTKEYNKNGDLIRYDSIKTQKTNGSNQTTVLISMKKI